MKTDIYFLVTPRWTLLRMRNVLDERCRENYKTLFMFNTFFPPEIRAVYVVMWEIFLEPARPHDIMAHAHCMLTT